LTLPNESFIINTQRRDYYRVNYDPVLWQRIIDTLLQNHTSVDTMVRVQLIDDVMNLARGGRVPYSTAFALLEYLKEETEYHPWRAALNAFGFLERRFVGHPVWTQISSKLNELMLNFWDENKAFYIEKDTTAIPIYAKVLALEWRCRLGNQDCNTEATHQFESIVTRLGTIDPNLQYVVYCSALRGEDQGANFDILWRKRQSSQETNEINIIRAALGCVKNETIVAAYLLESLEVDIRFQDSSSVYLGVLAGNPESVDLALDFLDTNFLKVQFKYQSMGAVSQVIMATAERLNTDGQYAKFKAFLEKNADDLGEDVNNAMAIVEANRNWLQTYEGPLKDYFQSRPGNTANQCFLSYILMGCILTVNILRYV